jgi:cytochrome c biogenesis protein CcmG, thiol:disulfide interchange protein DsbE
MTSTRRVQVAVGVAGGALAALILVIAVALAQGVGGVGEGRRTTEIREAPLFTLPLFEDGDWDGELFALADHIDRPVFIYFWASWCIPCEVEAPIIESLWPEYREQGWTFIGMNIWDAESDARRFLDRIELTFPVVRDMERNLYLDYGVQGLPVAFFMTPGLEIYARYDGLPTEQALRDLLDEGTEAAAGAVTRGGEGRS